MKFGLIFFSSSEAAFNDDKYHLVLESVKFADRHGFSSVWIPERHFTRDGWLYPNPAVLQAALARETTQIGLRAGSVVMPLHNPIRVAEEWAMVDNLSKGRVGVSFASGWHSNDFVFFPERYANRHDEMYRGIETVRRLWRGESIRLNGGDGNQTEVRIFPAPVQATLPIWLTASGNPQTFAKAGEIGANLLTHMFNQSIEELTERIGIYRESLARHGRDVSAGKVTLMLHTFIGQTEHVGHPQVRARFCEYLKSASYLLNAIAASRGRNVDFTSLSGDDLEDYLGFVFDRLITNERVLFGTPQSGAELIARLSAIGVDEVACQLDFGVDADIALESLPYLNQLKDLCETSALPNGATDSISARAATQPAIRMSPAAAPIECRPEDSYPAQPDSLEQIAARCSEKISTEDFYRRLRTIGVQLGDGWRGIESVQRGDGEALACIQLPDVHHPKQAYQFQPGIFDTAIQVLIAALPPDTPSESGASFYRSTGIRRFELYGPLDGRVWSYASLRGGGEPNDGVFDGDVRLLDDAGSVLAKLWGVKLKRVKAGSETRHERRESALQEACRADPRTAWTRQGLLSMTATERQSSLKSYLQEILALALKFPLNKVDPHLPLNNLGMDSLMAVELKKQVEVDFGVGLRLVDFLSGHSIAHLAELVAEKLNGAGAPESLSISKWDAERALSDLDQLSDAEVDSLLASVLADEEAKNG